MTAARSGNVLALIPARGGSKRLPRKNVIPFLGKPMVAHSIEAARDCGCFSRIVVSTEDEEIAAVAAQWGAEVDRRSPDLATDQARVTEVTLDLLAREEAAGRHYDAVCCLYATVPLRRAEDIAAVVGLVTSGQCDFAMAVSALDICAHQALKPAPDGSVQPMWPDLVNLRTSEIGPLYMDNGSTYCVATQAFRQAGSFYGPGLRVHVMDKKRSVDVDYLEDLELLEFYARRLSSS